MADRSWKSPFHAETKPVVQYQFYIEGALAKGFYLGGIDIGISLGNRQGVQVFRDYYELIVSRYHLSRHVRIIGQSNGGLMVYNYAEKYPKYVDRILAVPVIDLARMRRFGSR